MYNNNIYNIKSNNWISTITTWVNWNYWDINIDLSYNKLNNLLLEEFWLNIIELIEESRKKWNFIIDKYNLNVSEKPKKWVYIKSNSVLIQKL